MLKKIKSTLLRWMGMGNAAPAPVKTAKNSTRNTAGKRQRQEPAAHRSEKRRAENAAKAPAPRKSPKPKSEDISPAGRRRLEEVVEAAAPRTIPPKPAALKEIPPVEGKKRFSDFPLHQDVLFGVQHAGFEYATPIQAMTLQPVLDGKDIAGKAQTGTGKTAAFLLATFSHLLNRAPRGERRPGRPRALVLAPTRELAIQIHKDAEDLGIYTGLNSVVVFGGMDHEKQRRSLNAPIDLLIGTPGRVIDYSRGSSLDLSQVEILIIDEADRMLDMGFIPDVKRIVAQLPRKGERQTMLFSATLEESILRLASGWLVEPAILESEPEKMVSENIEQTFYSVLREEKLALTLYFIKNLPYDRMLIFGNRKDINSRLQEDLERYGYRIPILSGDIPQDKRIKILEKFRSGEEKIVIATDVAARGIHVDDVSLVINYDLPERAEDYVHRIGRTGRAGHLGKSISFLCEYGAYNLPAIEELLGVTFSSTQPEEAMLQLPEPLYPPRRRESRDYSTSRPRSGGRPGGRSGGPRRGGRPRA